MLKKILTILVSDQKIQNVFEYSQSTLYTLLIRITDWSCFILINRFGKKTFIIVHSFSKKAKGEIRSLLKVIATTVRLSDDS